MMPPISWLVAGALFVLLGLQTLHVSALKTSIAQTSAAAFAAATAGLKMKIEGDKKVREANEQSDLKYAADRDRFQRDLDDARTVRLPDSLAPIVIRARSSCPAAPGQTKRADDPIGVLADVLSRSDGVSEVYARTADERGIAGADCERRYDNLRRGTGRPGEQTVRAGAPSPQGAQEP